MRSAVTFMIAAIAALAALQSASAQTNRPRSRDDLLDSVVRRMQLCAETGDSAARLACYDKLSSSLNGRPDRPTTPPGSASTLAPAGAGATAEAGPSDDSGRDLDRAFNPHDPTDRRGVAAAESYPPPPPVELRRTGPRPVNYVAGDPLLSLQTMNFGYNEERYWQVTVELTNNTARTLYPDVLCTFTNGNRPVRSVHFTPAALQGGEQVTANVIGPRTINYADGVTCKVVSPLT